MELVDYLRMLRRQWVWVVGSVVVLTALAVVYTMTAPKTYKATADLFVGSTVVGTTPADNASALSASNYVFDRVTTYSQFADQAPVLNQVIKTLNLGTTSADLSKQISASVVPDTVIISVSATDASAAQAQKLANATALELGNYIKNLDVAGTVSSLAPTVTQQANLPSAPDSPNRNLVLALGVLVGLALGLVLASLRDQMRRTRPAKGGSAAAATSTPSGPAPSTYRPEPTQGASSPFAPSSDGVAEQDDEPSAATKPVPSASLEAALASTQARTRRPAKPSEPISVPPSDGSSSR